MTANDFFELSKPCYIENWPDALFNHSIATVYFRLSPDEVDAMLAASTVSLDCGSRPDEYQLGLLKALEDRIDSYIRQLPAGAFIRLGSRSPKDSLLGHQEGFQCKTGMKALQLLLDSERIYEDLNLARHNHYQPAIVIREWIHIEHWQELRCFYRQRELRGISQYFYQERLTRLIKYKDSIEFAIQQKSQAIKDLLPCDNIIIDYVCQVKERSNERVSSAILLELNPFGIWTDPCLFNWSRDKFNEFEFRLVG
jgi:hypothetical protein